MVPTLGKILPQVLPEANFTVKVRKERVVSFMGSPRESHEAPLSGPRTSVPGLRTNLS